MILSDKIYRVLLLITPGGIRTHNLPIRSRTPYPFGHKDFVGAFSRFEPAHPKIPDLKSGALDQLRHECCVCWYLHFLIFVLIFAVRYRNRWCRVRTCASEDTRSWVERVRPLRQSPCVCATSIGCKATLDHSVTHPLIGVAGFEPASPYGQLRLMQTNNCCVLVLNLY